MQELWRFEKDRLRALQVELIGYCMEGNVRMLVYEFMAFGSLADHLHGEDPATCSRALA